MNPIRSFRLVLLALLATVVSAGLLSAGDYECKFTLPFEAMWGKATLLAGDYSFTLSTDRPYDVVKITEQNGNGASFIMASATGDTQPSGRSELILVRHGNKRTVRALALETPGIGPKKGWSSTTARPKANHRCSRKHPC